MIARRRLGSTGQEVSVLGLGTWAMGGDEWGTSDDQQSIDVLREAVARGVNLIDTADVYGLGRSEELVAEAVPAGADALVVTKVGWDIYTDPPVVGGARRVYDRAYIEHAHAESCRRLHRSVLDVYLLHNPTTDDLATSEGLAVLRDIKDRGGARWIGVSAGSEQDALAAIHAGVDVVQLPLNVVRNWGCRVLPAAASRGVGVIAREPLERGLLTGKYGAGQRFPEGDHRNDKGEEWLSAGLAHVDRLRTVADEVGSSVAAAAIAYTLSYPEVAATVCGARTVEQLRENITSAATTITAAHRTLLEAGRRVAR